MFSNKTFFISGASRGIGKAIALKLAAAGANIIVAAKSVEEDPRLGGTIFSAADEIRSAGGQALPVKCDIRNEEEIKAAVEKGVAEFGGINGLINNASAIGLTGTEQTEVRRFDLMFDINVRGTFLVTQAALPHLKKSSNAHILTLSPPVNLSEKWLKAHIAYTLSKYNMSLMAIAWSSEFKDDGIASNALWPKTTIATAAVQNLLGGDALMKMSRKPEIIADAAFAILSRSAATCTGNTFIDEEVLKEEGISDFSQYAVDANARLYPDLFL